MISVRDALDRVLQGLPSLGGEQVALTAARGRVLAAPIQAPRDVPPFRNSAMDGYAVCASDSGRRGIGARGSAARARDRRRRRGGEPGGARAARRSAS